MHGKFCDNMKITEQKYSLLALIWFQTNFENIKITSVYNLTNNSTV